MSPLATEPARLPPGREEHRHAFADRIDGSAAGAAERVVAGGREVAAAGRAREQLEQPFVALARMRSRGLVAAACGPHLAEERCQLLSHGDRS